MPTLSEDIRSAGRFVAAGGRVPVAATFYEWADRVMKLEQGLLGLTKRTADMSRELSGVKKGRLPPEWWSTTASNATDQTPPAEGGA